MWYGFQDWAEGMSWEKTGRVASALEESDRPTERVVTCLLSNFEVTVWERCQNEGPGVRTFKGLGSA